MVGPAHLYKSSWWGAREEGKYPTHGTRSKLYLTIVAKHILIPVVFSGFSHGTFLKHYFVFSYSCNALQNQF